MDQTIIENGNNVETYLYKNRVMNSVKTFEGQMSRKYATEGKIIGKGNYEFRKVDGKLVQVIPQTLHKPVKRMIDSLLRDGIISSTPEVEQTNAVESMLAVEEAVM